VIGMLILLSGTTRPDILFTVHQYTKYCNQPKRSHEVAVKRIGRYLKKMRDKGLTFKPNGSDRLDCNADVDFAGAWCPKDSDQASSVLSRTGYFVTY